MKNPNIHKFLKDYLTPVFLIDEDKIVTYRNSACIRCFTAPRRGSSFVLALDDKNAELFNESFCKQSLCILNISGVGPYTVLVLVPFINEKGKNNAIVIAPEYFQLRCFSDEMHNKKASDRIASVSNDFSELVKDICGKMFYNCINDRIIDLIKTRDTALSVFNELIVERKQKCKYELLGSFKYIESRVKEELAREHKTIELFTSEIENKHGLLVDFEKFVSVFLNVTDFLQLVSRDSVERMYVRESNGTVEVMFSADVIGKGIIEEVEHSESFCNLAKHFPEHYLSLFTFECMASVFGMKPKYSLMAKGDGYILRIAIRIDCENISNNIFAGDRYNMYNGSISELQSPDGKCEQLLALRFGKNSKYSVPKD